jgi:DNA-binding transcriptional MerR regulator
VADDGELLTIEQLATRTGLTVRNIRSHVTRGLLPPPHLKGRTGFYGPEHVARLQLITGLQQQGFNLAAIRKLVAGPLAPSADETVAFYRTALGPWLTESPEVWEEPALASAFGLVPDPALVDRLTSLGLLERMPDGRVRVLNPTLLRVGRSLAGLGFGIDDLLAVLAVLQEHSRSVADAFVQMFLDVHWQAYLDAGMPPERLPEMRALIEQLQPLASQAVVAAFQQAMTGATGRAFEREAAAYDLSEPDHTAAG